MFWSLVSVCAGTATWGRRLSITARVGDVSFASGEQVTRFGPGGVRLLSGGVTERDNSAKRGNGECYQ
jgi:hypothetical protein